MNLRRKVKPSIKRFAKELRKRQTPYEEMLWKRLRCKRFFGVRWHRQSVIRGYIVDFYCPAIRTAVEVDGPIHDPQRDAIRDKNIFRRTGILVLRFSNESVQNSIGQVLERIADVSGLRAFSTNPQRSSSSYIDKFKNRVRSDESCGNSGKVEIRSPCGRQVFSNLEIAENTARSLLKVEIAAIPERCVKCGLVHIREMRLAQ